MDRELDDAGRAGPIEKSNETNGFSPFETGQMSAVETGQMSAAVTGEMSAVEARHVYSIQTGQRPVAIVDICLVSTADICPVSTADISISIHHSASAFSINNQHIMEAATAADFWLP